MTKIIKARRVPAGAAAALTVLAAMAAGGVAHADDSPVKARAPYAQASARVNADGTREQSKGIKSLTQVQAGVYCVQFDDPRLDVSRSTPSVAPAWIGAASWSTIVFAETQPTPSCSNAADTLTVVTGTPQAGFQAAPFFLVVP